MAASDHINKTQWFHASPHDLEEGTVLQPPSVTGIQGNFPKNRRTESVSLTTELERARGWASMLTMSHSSNDRDRHDPVHIYEVEPTSYPQKKTQWFDSDSEWNTPSAKVLRKVEQYQIPKP